jgi:hypothetical protein
MACGCVCLASRRSQPHGRVEFVLENAQEPFAFVIRKQARKQESKRSMHVAHMLPGVRTGPVMHAARFTRPFCPSIALGAAQRQPQRAAARGSLLLHLQRQDLPGDSCFAAAKGPLCG